MALVALAPHACSVDANRSYEDDPTALRIARCLLREAAMISTTTAARAMAHQAFVLLGTTTTVMILNTWTSCWCWNMNSMPVIMSWHGLFCEFTKQLAAVLKHPPISSRGQQAFAPPSRRGIFGRAAQLQGPLYDGERTGGFDAAPVLCRPTFR